MTVPTNQHDIFQCVHMFSMKHLEGHSKEECSVLKDKIKDLIMLGLLKDFVHKPQTYQSNNGYKQGKRARR